MSANTARVSQLPQGTIELLQSLETISAKTDTLLTERKRIAQVLADFYRAELSASSLQPVLTLAEELNPSLRKG